MRRRRPAVLAIVLALGACGQPDGPCERLQPTFMALFEANIAEAIAGGPSGHAGAGLGPSPDRQAAARRELAHVRGRFAGACRKLGAPELARCVELAKQRRAAMPGNRPPDDVACSRLDKQLEEELYRGFE